MTNTIPSSAARLLTALALALPLPLAGACVAAPESHPGSLDDALAPNEDPKEDEIVEISPEAPDLVVREYAATVRVVRRLVPTLPNVQQGFHLRIDGSGEDLAALVRATATLPAERGTRELIPLGGEIGGDAPWQFDGADDGVLPPGRVSFELETEDGNLETVERPWSGTPIEVPGGFLIKEGGGSLATEWEPVDRAIAYTVRLFRSDASGALLLDTGIECATGVAACELSGLGFEHGDWLAALVTAHGPEDSEGVTSSSELQSMPFEWSGE